MRYYPGTIALSEARDLPLLRVVLHSRFISHKQLFELARYETFEPSIESFSNRIRRLINHQLIQTHIVPHAGRVYSIATAGLMPLLRRGEASLLSVNSKVKQSNLRAISHCLDINDIHLAFRKSGLLVRWISETTIRSRNELTGAGYSKDYDGVVGLRMNNQIQDFAMEYERTPKAAQYYGWIRERIEAERHVAAILYICANFELLTYVAGKLRECRKPVYLGLFWEFINSPRVAGLVSPRSLAPTSLEVMNSGPD